MRRRRSAWDTVPRKRTAPSSRPSSTSLLSSMRSGPSPAKSRRAGIPRAARRAIASTREACPFFSTSRAAVSTRSGPATAVGSMVADGSSTPMWITSGDHPDFPTSRRSSSAPCSLIARTKHASRAFRARRLFSAMSQRWAVKLHGIPERRDATSAMVALVPAQWAWMCSAPIRLTSPDSQCALGSTDTFFAPIRGARGAAIEASDEPARRGERMTSDTAAWAIGHEVRGADSALSSLASGWTISPDPRTGTTRISHPARSRARTSVATNGSPSPNGSRAVT